MSEYRIVKNKRRIGKRFRVEKGSYFQTRNSLSGFECRKFRVVGEWSFDTESEACAFLLETDKQRRQKSARDFLYGVLGTGTLKVPFDDAVEQLSEMLK